MYFMAKSCMHTVINFSMAAWTQPNKNYAIFVPLLLASATKFYKTKFRGSAQNSVFYYKLLSLIIIIIQVSKMLGSMSIIKALINQWHVVISQLAGLVTTTTIVTIAGNEESTECKQYDWNDYTNNAEYNKQSVIIIMSSAEWQL